MVNFKILLMYKGSQQRANTITRQKTVFATSLRFKIKAYRWYQNKLKLGGEMPKRCKICQKVKCYLLDVFAQCILSFSQHLPGHQGIKHRSPKQRHAEVETKQPPVFRSFINLLFKHSEAISRVCDSSMRETIFAGWFGRLNKCSGLS